MSASIFKHQISPQRRRLLQRFVQQVRTRKLRTEDLMLVLVMLRELTSDDALFEWGSAIAHGTRDQGETWQMTVELWATQIYYRSMSADDIKLTPLPVPVFETIKSYVNYLTQRQIDLLFENDILGISKQDIVATLDHLYSRGKRRGRRSDPGQAFYFLVSPRGIPDEDRLMLGLLIRRTVEYALNEPPIDLAAVVEAMARGLKRLGLVKRTFGDRDTEYLLLHLLCAFHGTLISIDAKNFAELTGNKRGDVQPMLFVSSMSNQLTLALGFFEHHKTLGYESVDLVDSSGHVKMFHDVAITHLNSDSRIFESTADIRLCLFRHPIEVVRWRGKFGLIAHERENSPFAIYRSRWTPKWRGIRYA